MATRTPVRRPDPVPARSRARPAEGRAQPTLDPATTRDDLADCQTVRRCREAGGPVHRPMAEPALRSRRLQALPGRPLERGLHQRLETLGGDPASRLQRQLPARPRLPARQAHLTKAGDRTAALVPKGRRMDPSPPGHPHRVRADPTQVRPDTLPRTRRFDPPRPVLRDQLTERQGERLPDWLDAVRQDDLPSLHTLAAGIDRDRDAVIAGLTLPWNSGVVEGHVNRIKVLKRQMFGRAGFHLLRKRVLLAP
ncbi:transposase [Streptomyces sp. NPDC012746]|uniref:transposase n=1 Tax=Streptomyces sp. NPDC012746 TaxID=3364845 RepID=UPI0036948E0B